MPELAGVATLLSNVRPSTPATERRPAPFPSAVRRAGSNLPATSSAAAEAGSNAEAVIFNGAAVVFSVAAVISAPAVVVAVSAVAVERVAAGVGVADDDICCSVNPMPKRILNSRRSTAGAASLSLALSPIELHPLTQLRIRLGDASPTLRNPLNPLGEREG